MRVEIDFRRVRRVRLAEGEAVEGRVAILVGERAVRGGAKKNVAEDLRSRSDRRLAA
jgi:hypothetical protein